MDEFVAQVERGRDGQLVGVLYQNGRRVRVHAPGDARRAVPLANAPVPSEGDTDADDAQSVPVQHRRRRDPIVADQARRATGDLRIHVLQATDEWW